MKLLRSAALVTAAIAALGTAVRAIREPANVAPGKRPWTGAAIFALTFKDWLVIAGGFAFLAAVGGFLLAASGIVPIKASSGHWAITEWFLHFSMKRSVATHTITVQSRPLEDAWLVVKGAGHFHTGCRPCHGSPDLRQPVIANSMTPQPPYLPPRIPEWERDELFYLVKHGVKFTGMPAWPAQQRDDEVWAMVAFLEALPSLSAPQYEALVQSRNGDLTQPEPLDELTGIASPPKSVLESCARCHGLYGFGRGLAAFPKLAGQSREYMVASLQAYAKGERYSGIMQPIAAGLRPEEFEEISAWYSKQARASDQTLSNDSSRLIERGRAIAEAGIGADRIPACSSCHGPKPGPANPMYPVLAGQYAEYLVLQLELFSHRQRGGTRFAHLMHEVVPYLTAEQMRDVAAYYESLGQTGLAQTSGR